MRVAAEAAWPKARPPLAGDLELRVTQYSERRIHDRDNLMKPIQDALQGVVYHDDRQVKDAASNWRNINGSFKVRNVARSVAVAFSDGSDFLHVRVWISATNEDLG